MHGSVPNTKHSCRFSPILVEILEMLAFAIYCSVCYSTQQLNHLINSHSCH